MRCSACQQTNRADARFCHSCGVALILVCARCGRSLSPDSAFCDGCGAPAEPQDTPSPDPASYTPKHLASRILRSRSALEGERKQVTVLFADVKGSMALSEQVDPEEWHRILDRFFAILAEGIHRFEGTINQYTGDGIMALFGAPLAHEDHAQRACHAALSLAEGLRDYGQELRRNHGLDFSVRMGLNSGDVIVGKIGDDMRMDYTAQGHTVGLAARLEELAEAGRAYISESTAGLVAGYFDLEDLGEFRVKGVRGNTRAFALTGLGAMRTRLARSLARGFSRFIGRGPELTVLEDALESSASGAARVVGISAEAGSGKSRLCHEFLEGCRARGLDVLQANGLAHARQIPMLPILELLREFFRLDEADTERIAREKIAGRLMLLDEGLRDDLPLAFDLMQVPDPERPLPRMDPATRQHQVFSVLRRAWRATGEKFGGVVLLEDLHWFDPASDALVGEIVEAIRDTRQLLILNFRPEYTAGWMDREHYLQLDLVPLGPEEIDQLILELLGPDPGLQGLPGLISDRTGGNPFFVEEVVQDLAESGQIAGRRGAYQLVTPVRGLTVPSSVRSLLAARIDRQAEREKHVLQAASVLGKRFARRLLGRITELPDAELATALSALREAEFLIEEAGGEGSEYVFRHPLTQEVAYASQLRDRRERLHAAAARGLAEAGGHSPDENAALISLHWEHAGANLDAARWRRRAAVRLSESNPAGAREHWRRIVSLLDEHGTGELEGEPADLMMEACNNVLLLSVVAGVSVDEMTGLYFRARALAEATEDTRALALLTGVYGLVASASTGELAIYIRHAREALELAELAGEPAVVLISSLLLGTALFLARQLPEGERVCHRGLEAAAVDSDRAGAESDVFLLHLQVQAAQITGHLRDPVGAVEQIGRAAVQAREMRATTVEMLALLGRAFLLQTLGDVEAVERDAERARAITSTHDSPTLCIFAEQISGVCSEMRGDWAAAEAAFATAQALSESHRTAVWSQPLFLARRARSLGHLGEFERARATAAGALQRSRQLGSEQEGALLSLASILNENGNPVDRDEIEACLDELETTLDESQALTMRPDLHQERATLARTRGDAESARRELEEARRLLLEMGAEARAAALRD